MPTDIWEIRHQILPARIQWGRFFIHFDKHDVTGYKNDCFVWKAKYVYFYWKMVAFPSMLSHTCVRYPGFSGHGVKCPILTTVVPGFSGDLIGCTIQSKWGPLRDLYLARKNLLCVWNKLFLGEIKFSQRRTRPVKSLWCQIVAIQESTNEWKNLTFFLNDGTYRSIQS